MCTSLTEDDERVLRKWTRSHAQRFYVYVLFSLGAVTTAVGGVWNLAETVVEGRRLGLNIWETLTGSPLVQPLESYRLLATAAPSYIMLSGTLLCLIVMLFVRNDARRYKLLQKLTNEKVTVTKSR